MKIKVIRVRKDGAVTLPADVRRRYSLAEGDTLTLEDLGGVLQWTPKAREQGRFRNDPRFLARVDAARKSLTKRRGVRLEDA